MSHLAQPRKGWENEHLATFLLSRIAFVARPLTVADDVGTDLFCTIFEVVNTDGIDYLRPQSSIAVQIKSKGEPFDVTNKLDYLIGLEVPYYIGVVDREEQALSLYSARYLPNVLSLGRPAKLRLVPVRALEARTYVEKSDEEVCRLLCPLVATLRFSDDQVARNKTARMILDDAAAILRSIASKLSHEYLFELPWGDIEIFTGRTSAEHFHENFFKRLAEVLLNLKWALGPAIEKDKVLGQAALFLSIFQMMSANYEVPPYLKRAAADLVAAIKGPID